jgi:hypothetical protein
MYYHILGLIPLRDPYSSWAMPGSIITTYFFASQKKLLTGGTQRKSPKVLVLYLLIPTAFVELKQWYRASYRLQEYVDIKSFIQSGLKAVVDLVRSHFSKA